MTPIRVWRWNWLVWRLFSPAARPTAATAPPSRGSRRSSPVTSTSTSIPLTSVTPAADTTIPVTCSVVYGTDDSFGSVAVDNDMQRRRPPGPRALADGTRSRYRAPARPTGLGCRRVPLPQRRDEIQRSTGNRVDPREQHCARGYRHPRQLILVGLVWARVRDRRRPATEWSTAGDGNAAWLEIDLGESSQMTGIAFCTCQIADGTAITNSFAITIDDSRTLGPYPTNAIQRHSTSTSPPGPFASRPTEPLVTTPAPPRLRSTAPIPLTVNPRVSPPR